MSFRKTGKMLILGLIALLALSACGGEPKKEEVTASLKKIMPVSFEILSINSLKEIPGLFEVVAMVDKQPVVLYVDKKVKYVVSGSIVSLETKENLTLEAQKKYQKK